MASSSPRCDRKILSIFLILAIKNVFCAQISVGDELAPEFISIEQKIAKENADYKEILFEVRGRNIRGGLQIKTTRAISDRNSECHDLNFSYDISERQHSDFKWAEYVLTVPKGEQGFVYLCLPQRIKNNNAELNPQIFNSGYKWINQGPEIKLNLDVKTQKVE